MDKPMQSARDFIQTSTFYKTHRNKALYRFSKDSKEKFEKFMSEISHNQNSEPETAKTNVIKPSLQSPVFDSSDTVRKNLEATRFPPRKKRTKSPDNYNFETSETKKNHILVTSHGTRGKSGNFAFVSPPRTNKNGETYLLSNHDNPQQKSSLTDRQLHSDTNREINFFRLENFGPSPHNRDEKTEFSSYVAPFTDRIEHKKDKALSDLKMESYRIGDDAAFFKDLEATPNPAYGLTLPKNSSRLEKKKRWNFQSSHDVSYLTNLRKSSPNNKVLPRLFESINSKISAIEHFDRNSLESAFSEKKLPWGSPVGSSPRTVFLQETATPSSHRISHFIEPMNSPFHGKEGETPKKDIMRSSAINFTRTIKKFGSEDLTQASFPQN